MKYEWKNIFENLTHLFSNFQWRNSRREMRLVMVYPIKRQRWRSGEGRSSHQARNPAGNGRQPESNQGSGFSLMLFSSLSRGARPSTTCLIKRYSLLTSDVMFSLTVPHCSDCRFNERFEFNKIEQQDETGWFLNDEFHSRTEIFLCYVARVERNDIKYS